MKGLSEEGSSDPSTIGPLTDLVVAFIAFEGGLDIRVTHEILYDIEVLSVLDKGGSDQLIIESFDASEPTTSHVELRFVESNLVNA